MPKKSASVLRRVPGTPEWIVTDYGTKAGAFDLPTLQAMAGGDCLYEAIRLHADYCVICDEEGRLKSLPVCVGLQLKDGTKLPLFGPLAIVRVRHTKKYGGTFDFVGLTPDDVDLVSSNFPWVAM
jgi:hypothetical protein